MDDIPILGGQEDRRFFNQVTAHYDAPAYVRRAQQVQGAYEQLLARCRRQRDEWLGLVRTRLGTVYALAGEWERLGPLLADDGQLEGLRRAFQELDPRLRLPVKPTVSARALRRALEELRESAERFNRRWQAFLDDLDLTTVNELREGYNRYYVLEKECAVGNPRLARHGFRSLPPLTVEDLARLFPRVPVPVLAGA